MSDASISLEGKDLENRADIPEFDRNAQYPEGTFVKKQADDGTYILGKASSPKDKCISIFEAVDKEAVSEHTSFKDELKSYGYGALGGMSKFSTGCRQFNDWFGEHILGLDYDRPNGEGGKSYRQIAQENDARDAEEYNKLREKAPCKSQFDDASGVTETTLDLINLYQGVRGGYSALKSAKGWFKGKFGGKPKAIIGGEDPMKEKSEVPKTEKGKVLEKPNEDINNLEKIEKESGTKVTNKSSGENIKSKEKIIEESQGKEGNVEQNYSNVDEIWNNYKNEIIDGDTGGKNPAQYMAEQLDRLGNENAYNRKCDEVNVVSKAMNGEANLEGAKIYICYVEKAGSKNEYRNGTFKIPCDVCGTMLDQLKIKVIRW